MCDMLFIKDTVRSEKVKVTAFCGQRYHGSAHLLRAAI